MLLTRQAINVAAGINTAIKQLLHKPGPRPEIVIHRLLGDKNVTGDQATQLINLALTYKCASQTTFNACLGVYARNGDVKAVLRVMEHMKLLGVPHDVTTHSALLKAYSSAGDTKRLMDLFTALRESDTYVNAEIYGVVVAHVVQMELASSNGREAVNGQHVTARSVLDEMYSRGALPDVKLFNNLLSLCMKHRNAQRLMEYYNEMTARGIAPNIYSYNMVLEGLRLCGDLETLVVVAQQMIEDQGVNPNTHTLNAVFLANKSYPNQPTPLSPIISALTARQHTKPDMITFNAIIHQYAGDNNFEKVTETIAQMTAMGLAPDLVTYNTLLQMCVVQGPEALVSLFTEMKSRVTPNARSYAILISSLCNSGGVDVALKYLDEMKEKGLVPTEVCYVELIDALGKQGDIAACLRLYRTQESENTVSGSLSVIVRDKLLGHLERLDPAEYLLVLSEMSDKYKHQRHWKNGSFVA